MVVQHGSVSTGRYEPELEAKQGIVLAELSELVKKPAKTPSETQSLVTERERRTRLAEDLTAKPIDESHAKSILVGLLDPLTRQLQLTARAQPRL